MVSVPRPCRTIIEPGFSASGACAVICKLCLRRDHCGDRREPAALDLITLASNQSDAIVPANEEADFRSMALIVNGRATHAVLSHPASISPTLVLVHGLGLSQRG
jgi:hypothetical protein